MNGKARGAVFTKPAVVEFMLDLAGYVADEPLDQKRLLEPSCGDGSFLLAATRRLLVAWRRSGRPDTALDDAVRAAELDGPTLRTTRQSLVALLASEGLSQLSAARVARAWLIQGDFLTYDFDLRFDLIIGNPPYVRQELVPPAQLTVYRQAFATMVGRADIYVPFFERSLGLLAFDGKLCFICADAWTRNDYGRELRKLVTQRYALRAYVDLYGLDAFESDVGAYPSITLIERGPSGPVATATAETLDRAYLAGLARTLTKGQPDDVVLPALAPGQGPWLLRGGARQRAVYQLEQQSPTLQQAGCRVGIGVATGADTVFVAPYSELPVEDDRKLPLAVNQDVAGGAFIWGGMGVVNPWRDGGGLVDLREFPKLAQYLTPHFDRLAARHTAKGNVAVRWYKTIDRITAALAWEPKLLVPDIRGDGDAIAYDDGTAYPHHNLYYITSQTWDLRALQALLRSGLARLFVDAYAVKIGGGYLRFQAQYLRRIRVPVWRSLDVDQQQMLREAGVAGEKVPAATVEQVVGLPAGSLSFLEEWH